jgi:anti-sigma factor RsiW
MMQPYVDGALTVAERLEAEAHLALCSYCSRRYRFEEELRHFVKVAALAPMDASLKQKLAALRTPLE